MGCMSPPPPCPMPMPMPMGCYPVLVAIPSMPQVQIREIEVDATTASKTAVTGGWADSRLTVEYYVDTGAASPSVTLTLVTNGQTTSWSDPAATPGYHVHHALPPVPPGTKVTLQANAALARLRWCESVCC